MEIIEIFVSNVRLFFSFLNIYREGLKYTGRIGGSGQRAIERRNMLHKSCSLKKQKFIFELEIIR